MLNVPLTADAPWCQAGCRGYRVESKLTAGDEQKDRTDRICPFP